MDYRITIGSREAKVSIDEIGDGYQVTIDGRTCSVDVRRLDPGAVLSLLVDGQSHEAEVVATEAGYDVHLPTHSFAVALEPELLARAGRQRKATRAAGPVTLASQMPGVVVEVKVVPGDRVEAGSAVVIVEAMKMQNEFSAPAGGIVQEVRVVPGDVVAAGQLLLTIDASGGAVADGGTADGRTADGGSGDGIAPDGGDGTAAAPR